MSATKRFILDESCRSKSMAGGVLFTSVCGTNNVINGWMAVREFELLFDKCAWRANDNQVFVKRAYLYEKRDV